MQSIWDRFSYAMVIDYSELENKINYVFKDKALLTRALTHSSYAYDSTGSAFNGNERLEFLGDAVLQIAVSSYLYKTYEKKEEGELTKLRAAVVCEAALGEAARTVSLGDYLFLGNGEDAGGGRNHTPILADAVEAVIGAAYLDGGAEAADKIIFTLLTDAIKKYASCGSTKNSKSSLQEFLQRGGKQPHIEYKIVSEEGPDHDKSFTAVVMIDGVARGLGTGKRKQEAEMAAAGSALDSIKR